MLWPIFGGIKTLNFDSWSEGGDSEENIYLFFFGGGGGSGDRGMKIFVDIFLLGGTT